MKAENGKQGGERPIKASALFSCHCRRCKASRTKSGKEAWQGEDNTGLHKAQSAGKGFKMACSRAETHVQTGWLA